MNINKNDEIQENENEKAKNKDHDATREAVKKNLLQIGVTEEVFNKLIKASPDNLKHLAALSYV